MKSDLFSVKSDLFSVKLDLFRLPVKLREMTSISGPRAITKFLVALAGKLK